MIREGKGKKDRLLPIGQRAATWLNKYLEEARSKLVVEQDERQVFLCVSGKGLTPGVLGNVVREYVKRSGIGKVGSCHLFRHAMATLMLENVKGSVEGSVEGSVLEKGHLARAFILATIITSLSIP